MLFPRIPLGVVAVLAGLGESIADDRAASVGTWDVVAVVVNGKEVDPATVTILQVDYAEDGSWRVRSQGLALAEGTSTNDEQAAPKTFDMETLATEPSRTRRYVGIYRDDDETRTLCFVEAGMPRPDAFDSPRGSSRILVTLKRAERRR